IWHKWQSYSTWISGFFLLVWIYYAGSDLYLIDPQVMALSRLSAAAIGLGGLAIGWLVYDGLCRSPLIKHEVLLASVGFAFIILMAFLFQQVFS
ncbi:urate hydroxylase PuuD, partial [Enterobacter hormaechei]|uniref:urate hydroxylase PuuD n=1 Tax=Enterobacter hormaechei TaxID=158836 RepID=UPI0013D66853